MSRRPAWMATVGAALLLVFGSTCNEARYRGRTVSSWIHDLTSKDDYKRRQACEALAAIGPQAMRAVPELAALLEDPNEGVQEFAEQALISIGDASVPALEPLLSNDDPRVRLLSASAIVQINPTHEHGAKMLVRALTGVGNRELSKRAADVIARIGKPLVSSLIASLNDPYPPVRIEVARVLGRIGRKAGLDALEALSKTAQDPDWTVRQEGLRALARVGSQEAVQDIIRLALEDSHDEVAMTAAMMMRYIGVREGVTGNSIMTDDEIAAAAEAAEAADLERRTAGRSPLLSTPERRQRRR